MLEQLNQRFGIAGQLIFIEGPGGMPHALITTPEAQAEIALQGAHVVRYGHFGETPILWLSRDAVFTQGKAIRGGIPLCWPWFGPHPSDASKPAHGFARNTLWEVLDSAARPDGLWVKFGLQDSPATQALWPHAFRLELEVLVGAQLDAQLRVLNPGAEPFQCGGALHSYFTLSAIGAASIDGLDGTTYLDQLTGIETVQQGPVQITAEVDRIYLDTTATCLLHDSGLQRTIAVAKSGSQSTVVWNPWIEKSKRFSDFADDEYLEMVCIETANAHNDQITVAPGGEHVLGTTIGLG